MKLKKGILIVIEGIDGTGKTTQAQILFEKITARGLDAVYFREPSTGKWGQEIKKKAAVPDSITPEEELELFQKDRQENVRENLRPSLAQNKVVILDRYYFSTIAYQGAKGIDQERILRLNEAFAVLPDLVFIMDIEPGEGLARISKRKKKDLLFEQEDYLKKVRAIFKTFKGENIFPIDSSKSIEDISREIEKKAFDYLASYIQL